MSTHNICFCAEIRSTCNEYPQHMFSCRNKKNIIWLPLISGAMVDPFQKGVKNNLIVYPCYLLVLSIIPVFLHTSKTDWIAC